MSALKDRFSRAFTYLRVSVTDRCNFRCVYCMPAEGVKVVPRADILSFEEIARVVRVGVGLGMTKVRLTGGEPTVRADLPVLVRLLKAIPGLAELSMTTNASRLAELAQPLKNAGLDRVNISLDSLDAERSEQISRRPALGSIVAGIDQAVAVGLTPLKLNAVVIGGMNEKDLPDLVRFAHHRGAEMRFIEYMPMGDARLDVTNRTVTAAEMRQLLSHDFDLVPVDRADPADPAAVWQCSKTGARVGFITSVSQHFCESCSRMRLTAEGMLRPCLHQDAEVDVREILRGGGDDQAIVDTFRRAAELKWAGHRMTEFVPIYSRREMVGIGG